MRKVGYGVLACLLLVTGVARAETVFEFEYKFAREHLDDAQMQIAIDAMFTYRIDFVRPDGRSIKHGDPEIHELAKDELYCVGFVVERLHLNWVRTPLDAANTKAECLRKLIDKSTSGKLDGVTVTLR